jgi:hypothetical protein
MQLRSIELRDQLADEYASCVAAAVLEGAKALLGLRSRRPSIGDVRGKGLIKEAVDPKTKL